MEQQPPAPMALDMALDDVIRAGRASRETRREAHRDTRRDTHRDSHRDAHRDAHRDTHRDSRRDTRHIVRRDVRHEARREESTLVRVTNLNPRVTASDLQRLFAGVSSVDLQRDGAGRSLGRADVRFASYRDARVVQDRLQHVPLDGYPLQIEIVARTPGASRDARVGRRRVRAEAPQRRERWAAGERRAQARVRHQSPRPAAQPSPSALDADLASYMSDKPE